MTMNQQILDASSKKSSAQDIYQQVASDSLLVEDVFLQYLTTNRCHCLTSLESRRQGLHRMCGHPNPDGEILISRLNLTRKQYYTRISQLRSAGLITRKRARFVLTSLGRVVYETHKTIGIAIQNRWRLQAIDLLENSLPTNRMPIDGRQNVINTLLGDCETIRNILLCQHHAE